MKNLHKILIVASVASLILGLYYANIIPLPFFTHNSPEAIPLENPNFSTGDLTGWDSSDAEVFRIDVNYRAILYWQGYIVQSVVAPKDYSSLTLSFRGYGNVDDQNPAVATVTIDVFRDTVYMFSEKSDYEMLTLGFREYTMNFLHAVSSGDTIIIEIWYAGGGHTPSSYVALDNFDLEGEVTAPGAPETYALSLTVIDQKGKPLPATVTVDTTARECDTSGQVSFDIEQGKSVIAKAKIGVGERTYEATATFLMSSDVTDTLIITRDFLWTFEIGYTDGTYADGTLTITDVETETASISGGAGVAYLKEGSYTLTFTASPQISLGTINVDSDQTFKVTIDKATGAVTESTTITPTVPVVTPPPIPWVLIPTTHVYILTAVVFIIGIGALYVQTKRRKR